MAEGGELLDQKQYWYDRLFGSSDFEEEQPLPSLPIVPPVVQTEPKERCILRLRLRKKPGTDMYENLSYQDHKKQAEEIQKPKVEDPKRKLHCEEKQAEEIQEPKVEAAKRKLETQEEKVVKNSSTARPKQVTTKCAKKKHGDSVRARIEWKSKHLGVRKSKHLGVHKPNLLKAF